MDVNSLQMNLLVTLLVAVLVFLLPWADRRICRKLRLNLEGCSLPGWYSSPGIHPAAIPSTSHPWKT